MALLAALVPNGFRLCFFVTRDMVAFIRAPVGAGAAGGALSGARPESLTTKKLALKIQFLIFIFSEMKKDRNASPVG